MLNYFRGFLLAWGGVLSFHQALAGDPWGKGRGLDSFMQDATTESGGSDRVLEDVEFAHSVTKPYGPFGNLRSRDFDSHLGAVATTSHGHKWSKLDRNGIAHRAHKQSTEANARIASIGRPRHTFGESPFELWMFEGFTPLSSSEKETQEAHQAFETRNETPRSREKNVVADSFSNSRVSPVIEIHQTENIQLTEKLDRELFKELGRYYHISIESIQRIRFDFEKFLNTHIPATVSKHIKSSIEPPEDPLERALWRPMFSSVKTNLGVRRGVCSVTVAILGRSHMRRLAIWKEFQNVLKDTQRNIKRSQQKMIRIKTGSGSKKSFSKRKTTILSWLQRLIPVVYLELSFMQAFVAHFHAQEPGLKQEQEKQLWKFLKGVCESLNQKKSSRFSQASIGKASQENLVYGKVVEGLIEKLSDSRNLVSLRTRLSWFILDSWISYKPDIHLKPLYPKGQIRKAFKTYMYDAVLDFMDKNYQSHSNGKELVDSNQEK